nr:hypothetical protein [uncultured Actinoplanes sp.]
MTDTDTGIRPVTAGEDLPAAIAAAAPRRWHDRATPWLLAAVLLAGGFLGGVAVQKTWGRVASPVASPSPDQRPSAGPGPRPGGGAPATTGTLQSVTATALTLRTGDGRTVTVRLGESTKIQQTATIAALTAGRAVTVQGNTGTDGTITATAVTAS